MPRTAAALTSAAPALSALAFLHQQFAQRVSRAFAYLPRVFVQCLNAD